MSCQHEEPKITCERRKGKTPSFESYADSEGNLPPYLPQRSDFFAKPSKARDDDATGVVLGPWATGRPVWSPTADLVGVRPVSDRYNITKYSTQDWRKNNLAIIEMATVAEGLKDHMKCVIDNVAKESDKNQNENAIRLTKRFHDIKNYQNQIEALVLDIRQEIVLLTEMKVRLKFLLPYLKIPESIAGECIDKRTSRIEPDLVKDEVDEELVKELSLIYEMKENFSRVLEQVEKQILTNRACKDRMESDWSDKKETCEIEGKNACLRNDSSSIYYRHGSTRVQAHQSSPETWQYYCESLIAAGSQEIKKSKDLRENIDANLITEAVRDLRNQADKVMNLLKKRIEETDLCRQAFEKELEKILFQIADTEALYEGLFKLNRQLDYNLKVAETRLDSRMFRPRTENCRDEPQYGLIDEVKSINQSQAALKKQIEEVDATLSKLYESRANLESAIITKRKSLYVDQQRCLAYREKYPDISKLTSGGAP